MRTRIVLLSVLAATFGCCVAPVTAQGVRVTSRMTMGGPGGSGEVSNRSLDEYIAILGLDSDQQAAAKVVHEGYVVEFRRASDTRRQALMEVQRKAEDTGDQGMFMEKLPVIQKEFAARSKSIEAAFFKDLRDLLTPDQDAKWPGVERARRREVGLRGQSLSGAGVDLVSLVKRQGLPADAMAALAEPLQQYEIEIDRVLQEAEKLRESSDDMDMSKGLDMAKLQERSKAWRDIGVRLQEINERTRSKLDGLMPELSRVAFAQAYKAASMPLVYRPARVLREVDSVLKMDDVTPEQKEKLAAIKAGYTRDAEGLNNAWASAIKASEANDQAGAAVALPGGGQMMMKMDDDPDDLKKARTARSDLDDRTAAALRAIMTAAQRERLDKAAAEEEGGTGQMMMIRATDDR